MHIIDDEVFKNVSYLLINLTVLLRDEQYVDTRTMSMHRTSCTRGVLAHREFIVTQK